MRAHLNRVNSFNKDKMEIRRSPSPPPLQRRKSPRELSPPRRPPSRKKDSFDDDIYRRDYQNDHPARIKRSSERMRKSDESDEFDDKKELIPNKENKPEVVDSSCCSCSKKNGK
jgi:hypothetical protein